MSRAYQEDERLAVLAGRSFRIYISGQGSRSRRAVADLRRLCEAHVPDGHDIEIVDVLALPESATRDGVVVTPAVLRLSPPTRWVFGDLTDSRLAAAALGLTADDPGPVAGAQLDLSDGNRVAEVDGGALTDLRDRIRPLPRPSGHFRADRGRSRTAPPSTRLAGRDVPPELASKVAGGVVVVDEDGAVLFCNQAAERAFGRPGADLVGRELGVPLVSDPTVVEVVTPDGQARTVEMRSVRTTWGPAPVHVLAVGDVSGRRRGAGGPESGEHRLGQVFEQSPIGLAVLDPDLRFVDVNGALSRMLAYTPAELAGLTLTDVTLGDDRGDELDLTRSLLAGDADSYELEKQYVRADNELFWGHVTASVLHDSSRAPSRVMAVIEDVTARRENQARLAHLALHDPLTGLPNRALALDRLRLVQARAERSGEFAAIFFVDLDRFKAVNDSLGHDAGDAFLVECARRLEGVLRATDTAARLGGDEFLVLCEDLGPEERLARVTALELAKRVATTLAMPVTLANGRAEATASIGIVLTNGEEQPVEVLLAQADSAMYRAKARAGNGCAIFDEQHKAEAAGRMQVADALRRALSRGELVVHYQPIVSLENQRIVAVEAMVRWNHPTRGLLLPAAFIDVAEENRLIIPLGDTVLHEACMHLARWRESVSPDLVVMVNASARQLGCDVFAASIASALRASGLEPGTLHIELTEGTLIEASGSTLAELKALRSLGVHLGLDDFGTGYASLTYLQRLPVDFVKIDGSFVAGVGQSPEDRAIIEAVIGLGHALGLRVIAEGIESEAQKKVLEEMGCELGQGWHFGYPQSAQEMTRLLTAES